MFPETDAFTALKLDYSEAKPNAFALFLGAGVNLPKDNAPVKFKTLSWSQLLEELYKKNARLYDRTFHELMTAYADDWPGLAEVLRGILGATRNRPEVIDIKIKNRSFCSSFLSICG